MSVNEREDGRWKEKWQKLYKPSLQLFLYDLFYKNNLLEICSYRSNQLDASIGSFWHQYSSKNL